ncbi:MAG: hypothetical protein AAF499_08070, partial [Pseudomonadota bacterium]
EREDKLHTQERGELQTYWLSSCVRESQRHLLEKADSDSSIFFEGTEKDVMSDQQSEDRWIAWNVSVFEGLLKQIIARRTTLLKLQTLSCSPEALATTWFRIQVLRSGA